jgi:hypothetical protein
MMDLQSGELSGGCRETRAAGGNVTREGKGGNRSDFQKRAIRRDEVDAQKKRPGGFPPGLPHQIL